MSDDILEEAGLISNEREGVPVYMHRAGERFVAGVAHITKDPEEGQLITVCMNEDAKDFVDAVLLPGLFNGLLLGASVDPEVAAQFE